MIIFTETDVQYVEILFLKKRVKSQRKVNLFIVGAKKKVMPHNLKGQVESITLNYAIMFMVVFTFIGVPYFPVL